MPALPSIPLVLKIDLQWTDGTDANVSTRQYFRISGSDPPSSDCVLLAADIYSHAAAMAHLWDPDTDLTGVKVTDLSSAFGGIGEHFQSTVGTRPSVPTPASTCVLVNYVIGRRYRGGKPRSYFPWLAASDMVSRQQWTGASLTEVSTALSTYFAAVLGTTVGATTITEHVNVSYYEGFTVVTNPITHRAKNVSTPRATPLVDPIQSWSVAATIASQRRRNRR